MKTLTTLFAIVLAFSYSITTAQGIWIQKANFFEHRDGGVGFSIAGKGYAATGSDNNGLTKDLWEYDPNADTWTQKSDFGGTARVYAVAFATAQKGYVGIGLDQNSDTKDFWEYDPALNSWKEVADFSGTARSLAIAFSIDGKGYVGTGFNWNSGSYFNDFWEYDPVSDSWSSKANVPGYPRAGAVGIAIDNFGYVGTGTGKQAYSYILLNDFWQYDPSTNQWNGKASLPAQERSDAVGFSIGSKGYLGGGDGYSSHSDFWEYDPSNNSWVQEADYGGGYISSAVAFSIDGYGYAGLNSFFGQQYQFNPIDGCTTPTGEGTTAVTATHATTYWDLVPTAIKYKVRYRITGNSIWTTLSTNTNNKKIKDLTPGTSYEWQVKSICGGLGNSNWSAKFNFITAPQRIAGDGVIASLLIYPNPTSSNITIELATSQPQSLSIKLFDVLGREVFSSDEGEVSGTFSKQLNLTQLTAGTYFLKVTHGDESEMRKVVRE